MSEHKKNTSSKRYALISSDSIKAYGEAAGHNDVPDDVASMLAEDVVYRIREIAQASCEVMKHSHRRKLTSEDFNKALRNSDAPPIFGYGSTDAMPFRQTRDGEIYFVEDSDTNLANIACGTHIPHQLGKCTVKAHFLTTDGTVKSSLPTVKSSLPSHTSTNKLQVKPHRMITEDQKNYFESITKAILGSDKELMKLALVDLRSNANISPLLPYFVNFISNGVHTLNHDIDQLSKILHTIRSIMNNPNLYLRPKPYLNMLVGSVLFCVKEPLAASNNPHNDHWKLRDYAARLLVQITRAWDNPDNKLEQENLDSLMEVLYDLGNSFSSHYGAIVALCTFGTQAVEEILRPQLPAYMTHLKNVFEDQSIGRELKHDARMVWGTILLSCEYSVRSWTQKLLNQDFVCEQEENETKVRSPRRAKSPKLIKSENSKPKVEVADGDLEGTVLQLPESTNPYKIAAELYDEYESYFGDSLSVKLPLERVKDFHVNVKNDDRILSLGDSESKKSGEELLQQILAAPTNDPVMSSNLGLDNPVGRSNGGYYVTQGDEKSSKIDKSNSDNFLFIEEDSDLTVKATVSDPARGIKLTIGKKRKLKASPAKGSESKRRRLKSVRISDVFDRPVFKKRKPFTAFRYQGISQRNKSTKRPHTVDQIRQTDSKYRNLCLQMGMTGKKQTVQQSPLQKSNTIHRHSATLSNIL